MLYTIFSFIFMIICIIAGIGVIGLVLYTNYKNNRFLKKGVPVKLKVMKVEHINRGEGLTVGYNVTYGFEYDGNYQEKTIKSRVHFTEGNEYEGLYLPDGSKNCISVEGEGFHVQSGTSLIFLLAGLFLIFFGIILFSNLKTEVMVGGVALFFILILGAAARYNVINNKKTDNKKNTDNERIYNKNIGRPIDSSLIRYIPEVRQEESVQKSNAKSFIFNLVFIAISCFVILLGCIIGRYSVTTYMDNSKKISEYKQGWAIVKNIITEEKESSTDDSKYSVTTYFYEYEVNGKKYIYEFVPTNKVKEHKIGEREKVYYNEKNPTECILESVNHDLITDIVISAVILVGGVMLLISFIRRYIRWKRRTIRL